MASSSGPNSIRPSSLSTSPTDLGPIIEDSPAQPKSPKTESIDFGEIQQAPRRSLTQAINTSWTPEERRPGYLRRAKTLHTSNHDHPTFPNKPLERIILGEASSPYPSQKIRRHSTIETKNSASFEETAVWDQKAILSLDGGGIRGYSALLIIQKLMQAIGRFERGYKDFGGPADSSYHPLPPAPCVATDVASCSSQQDTETIATDSSPWLPCHYFDYMAGTSTGGLISIMLGRLRMNIDDCISDYETLGADVFGHSRCFHIRSPLFWIRDKYSERKLEKVLKSVVSERVPKVASFPGGNNFAFDENRCRAVVIAYQKQAIAGIEKPYLFRTYKNLHKSSDPKERPLDRNPALAHDIPIWQVARATSAAPTYFKPIVIDGLEYLDGGFGANNPSEEIYHEVRKMNNKAEKCVGLMVSIGTGKNNKMRRFYKTGLGRYFNYLNFARKWASDSEKTHEAMLRTRNDARHQFPYYRLNVEEGLDLMKLDEWRARGPLRREIGRTVGRLRSHRQTTEFREENISDMSLSEKTSGDVKSENGQSLNRATINDLIQRVPTATSRQSQMTTITQQMDDDVKLNEEQILNKSSTAKGQATHGAVHTTDILSPATKANMNDERLSKYLEAEQLKVPEWLQSRNETLEVIRKHTDAYLSRPKVQIMIEECAQKLVEGRRGRAKTDPQRWEKACFGAWYQCNIGECPRGEKEYQTRKELRRHLLDKHCTTFKRGVDGDHNLEAKLDGCKVVVH